MWRFRGVQLFTAWREWNGVHQRTIRRDLHEDEKYPEPYVYYDENRELYTISIADGTAFMSARYVIDIDDSVLRSFTNVDSVNQFLDHHILIRLDSPEKTVPPPSAGLADMLNLMTVARANWLLKPNPYTHGETDMKFNPLWTMYVLGLD